MAITVEPLSDAIGAEISGVDPGLDIGDGDFEAIRQAWLDHCILLFRGLDMSPEQQVAFTRRLGTPHIMAPAEFNLPGHPELFQVSNLERGGEAVGLRRAGQGWHSDGEDKEIPNAGSFLHAHIVPPEGGDTMFANMYRAHDALPDDRRRRIEGRRARFSRAEMHHVHYPDMPPLNDAGRRARPDVWHPLVREHPESGRKALFIGRWAVEIEGLPADEGRDLIAWLQDFAVRDAFTYRHRWRVGDAILWDNRCTQHRAMPFDDERFERHMLRTTLEGDLPFCGAVRSETVPVA